LVGLQLDGDEVPVHGDGVYVDKRKVGVVTSATRSPSLGCAIAMARVASEWAEGGARLEIGSVPFVDPERERPRA